MKISVERLGKSGKRIAVIAVLNLALAAAIPAVHAATRTWSGNGADDLASNTNNWQEAAAPQAGDDIVFTDAHSGNPQTNVTWDVDPGVTGFASWTQTTDYDGTVTIMTRYPDAGGFTNLHVSGNVTLEGGTWTHFGVQNAQTYNLGVSVGGDFTLGASASVNVDGKGWTRAFGGISGGDDAPGNAVFAAHSTHVAGAAHGGMGGFRDWQSDYTYGSIFAPIHLGSGGGRSDGGGAVRLFCDGKVTVNADFLARSLGGGSYSGASGGSIFIRASEFEGTGLLSVSSVGGSGGGGGGRIAVVLTSGTGFGDVSMQAYGHAGNLASGSLSSSVTRAGAAGTIYLQKAGQSINEGTLVLAHNPELNNGEVATFFGAVTTLPANQMSDASFDFNAFEKIIVKHGGVLFARPDVTLDLTTANINPDGWTNGWIAVMQTNNLVFPANDFVLDSYNILFGTNWVYDGNLTMSQKAEISHLGSMDETQDYMLDMTIIGDLTVDTNARINVSHRGFLHGKGPGNAIASYSGPATGASHGGRGANSDGALADTYGSFLEPTTFGSGGAGQWNHAGYVGYFRGGGAARIDVGGSTQLHGNILARGGNNSNWSTPASGGSIWLTTGSLTGSGTIDARGGIHANSAGYHGGGGRIAVYLADSQSFGDVELLAHGWRNNRNRTSAAGTLYLEWPGPDGSPRGELRIDNAGKTVDPDWVYTPIPADLEAPELNSPWQGASHVTLVITNRAQVALNMDMRMLDLFLHNDADPTRLHLQGNTLFLRSAYHSDWGHEDWVEYDGGEIIWTQRGTIMMLR